MRYAPDGNTTEPGVLREVYCFAPNNNGAYQRIPSLRAAANALAAACLGSAVVKNLAGTAKLYAGSATKVYQADGASGWTDRSAGTTFGSTTWDFCAFGDKVIAANGTSKLQSATTGNFADIASAPTGAIVVYPHANGLVALGTAADGAAWSRSKSGDSTTWTPAANNDADAGTLYGGIGGPITAGCSWENQAIAWKSRAMYAGLYVGNSDPDQEVIRWQTIASDVGCVAKNAWIATEVGIVFVSERGVMLYNGNKPVPIDADIRKAFMADAMTDRSKICCSLDEGRNHVYIWVVPTGGTVATSAYIWNYRTGLWGHLIEVSNLTGVTIGGARTVVRNANYRDIVAIGGLGSNTTETANLFFESTGHYLCNLSYTIYAGATPPGDGFIRTGLVGIPGMDSTVVRVIPVSDAYITLNTNVTLILLAYNSLFTQVGSVSGELSSKGQWDVLQTGRYFELQITADDTSGGPSYQKFVVEFKRQGSERIETLEI